MTDEEKAEEYINTHCCYYRQDFIRTYLDGLAEGRKEVREHETTCINRLHFIEKENAELIDKLNLQNQRLNELKKENEELLESCRDKDRQLNNWFISYNEVIKENEQLKVQIEKMKEKLKQINQIIGIFSHHSGDTGYGIMLTEIELRKLQDIYQELADEQN